MTRFFFVTVTSLLWVGAGAADPSPGPEGSDAGPAIADAAPAADAAPVPTDAPPPGDVRFAEVFGIFYSRCTGCHHAGTTGRAPEVSSADTLVGIESSLPGVVLVVPGDPDASYLYRKLEGTHADVCASRGLDAMRCGDRMPGGVGAAPLGDDELAIVRAWIEGGARP